MLILYNYFCKEKFGIIYTKTLLFYSQSSLFITILLAVKTDYSTSYFNLFLVNYKILFIQVIILLISLFCLLLFHRSLTKSRTNCLKYFILYLFNVLLCLIILMLNTEYIFFLFLSFELVVICFYILCSFNYNNFGFLFFRFIPKRKLMFISALLGFLGLILLKGYIYLNDLDLLYQRNYFLITSIILLSISLILKIIIFYAPTNFIYYQKTPAITIIFMHLVPKVFFFYFFSELVFTNYYFIYTEYYINLVTLITGIICLVISIGMRRLFLKHFLEYLALVNSGYLFLCFTPLTYNSLNYCIYFLLFYILIIFLYGGIFLFFDNQQYPSLRLSFDVILSDIDKKDYYSIIFSSLIFLFFGMPPTRRDYPCSRGIPFNGLILQSLVFQSLLLGQMYLILFFLVIFNLIVFLFFIWTIVPFWYERKDNSFLLLPSYINPLLGEFIITYFSLLLLTLCLDSILILNFLKTFYR